MRASILPHLTAPADSWTLGGWRLSDGTRLPHPSAAVPHWDYAYRAHFLCEAAVNGPAVMDACGLGEGASTSLMVVATFSISELPVVSSRYALDPSRVASYELGLELDPTVAGGTMTLERQIVLDHAGRASGALAATQRGAVLLAEGSDGLRVGLEGEGSRFPTDLRDFARTGIGDSHALWYLDVDMTRLDDQVASAVRLYVNSGHPAVRRMQESGSDVGKAVASVMGWDVARQLIARVVVDPLFEEGAGSFEEGSVGHAVERLIEFYLEGDDADGVRRLLQDDPGRFERRLQHATRMMRDV